jgi:hypothetical protein
VTFLTGAIVERLREVATLPDLPAGRYTLRRAIGRGGRARRRDTWLERDVTVKVSNPPVKSGELEARIRKEPRGPPGRQLLPGVTRDDLAGHEGQVQQSSITTTGVRISGRRDTAVVTMLDCRT